tara:strand:- start:1989 stop:3419 length:1431 start_codon:yes stop_codon:yes gene_type:complete
VIKLKNILLLLLLWVFFGCQSPSEPNASLVNMVHVEYTNNDALSIDVDDSHIVIAASDDGYFKFAYQLDNGILNVSSISDDDFDGNHDVNFANDSFDRAILSSNNGLVYLLDRGLGGSSGIWLDNISENSMDTGNYVDNCYQSKYIDVAIDDVSDPGTYELVPGIPDTAISTDFSHTIYALLKHTNLGGLVNFACDDEASTPCSPEFPNCPDVNGSEGTCAAVPEYECSDNQDPCNPDYQCTNGDSCSPGGDCSDGSDCSQVLPCNEGASCVTIEVGIQQYSSSIVKRKIDFIGSDNLQLFNDNGCELLFSGIGYYSKDIDYYNNIVAVANQSEGIMVFEYNEDDDLVKTLSFNVPGAEAQSVHLDQDVVFGGFSTSSGGNGGCYMALLGANSNNDGNYDGSFADGYSVKSIDTYEDLIGLATGNSGVQIYQRIQGSSVVSPYLSIDTDYAYDLKIKNNFVFVATKSGLEIYKIGT